MREAETPGELRYTFLLQKIHLNLGEKTLPKPLESPEQRKFASEEFAMF